MVDMSSGYPVEAGSTIGYLSPMEFERQAGLA
jgi:hypothetical protein